MRRGRQSLVVAIVMLAVFLGYLEMTVVVTALPTLGRAFPSAVAWLPWLTTVSLMAAAVALPLAGKLADDWGAKRVFLLGTALFTLGSLFSGLVGIWLPSRVELLIGFRVLQGLGGGAFAPVGLKLISVLYRGKTRTTTVGLAGAIGPLAAMIGPNVGGILVDHLPWQSIFLVNAPLALALGIGALFAMEHDPAQGGRRIDVGGALLLPATTMAVMLCFTWMRQGGPASVRALGTGLLALCLAALLYRLETRHPAPLLEPALFRDRDMAAVLALSFFQGLAAYSTLFFMSFYAQSHPGIRASASAAGMALSPAALGQALAAPLAGFLAARAGYRPLVVIGTTLSALSVLALGAQPTQLMVLAALFLVARVGGTLVAIPLAAAGLEVRRAQAGALTGLRQLCNVLGGVIGPVALSALLPPASASAVTPGAFARVFLLIGLLLALTLPLVRMMPAKG